jgi:hypothetical protein
LVIGGCEGPNALSFVFDDKYNRATNCGLPAHVQFYKGRLIIGAKIYVACPQELEAPLLVVNFGFTRGVQTEGLNDT